MDSPCSRSTGGSRPTRSDTSSTTPTPALLVVEPPHAELARQAGGDVPRVAFAELDADRPVPPVDVSDDDPLLLSYTSGTTGKPKGAVLTHANCFWTNLSFDRTSGIADGDVVLQVLPQFHSGGWNVQALLAWWKGATVVSSLRSTRHVPLA